jgi:plastocyanin
MTKIVSRGWWIVNRAVVAAAIATATASCGGGSSTPASPSSGGSTGTGSTVTITSSGVSPATLTVSPGTRVTFVNNSGGTREVSSNPHPEHTDCIEINQVGNLTNGQSRETGNLNTVRTCGYHDHNDPDNSRWQGSIVVR